MTPPDRSAELEPLASVTSFTVVAPFYDDLMAGVPYKFWVEYIASLMRSHNQEPRSILDVACGTGTVAIELTRRGYRVSGVDLSDAMIEVARQKSKDAGCDINFYAQDAAELSIPGPFDAVISLFDSLNNIIEPERLANAFRQIYDRIAENGCFIFDLNTEIAFAAGMFNQKSHPIDGPLQYVWRAKYDAEKRLCTVKMDFTLETNCGEPLRFQEVHVQRAYSKDDINRMLREAGFQSITVYDAYTHKPPKPRSDRLFFVAIKQAA